MTHGRGRSDSTPASGKSIAVCGLCRDPVAGHGKRGCGLCGCTLTFDPADSVDAIKRRIGERMKSLSANLGAISGKPAQRRARTAPTKHLDRPRRINRGEYEYRGVLIVNHGERGGDFGWYCHGTDLVDPNEGAATLREMLSRIDHVIDTAVELQDADGARRAGRGRRKPDQPMFSSGWIAPDGRFFACQDTRHCFFAEHVLAEQEGLKSESDFEKAGWIKITRTGYILGKNDQSGTQAQMDTLFDLLRVFHGMPKDTLKLGLSLFNVE